MALTKVTSGLISASASSVDLNIDAGTLYIDSTNNRVGIGTVSPQARLHVSNGSAGIEFGPDGVSDGTSYIQAYDRVASSYDNMRYYAATHNFYIGESNKLTIDSSGNVGIGTSSPTAKLRVNTPVNTTSTRLGDDAAPTRDLIISSYAVAGYNGAGWDFNANGQSAAGTISFSTNATERMRIDSSGNVGIGTNSPTFSSGYTTVNIGANSIGSILKLDGADSDFYHRIFNNNGDMLIQADQGNVKASSTMRFYVDASERMIINASGNVGIGTSSPSTELHVAGDSSTRNTIVANLTLDGGSAVGNPYNGFGFGINFIGRDYGNAVRNYAHIYSVMEAESSSAGGGDAGFKSFLSFYTNSGGASGTNPTEKMRINSDNNVSMGRMGTGAELILGTDAYSIDSNYVGMKTAYQSGSSDYMILSGINDGNTYVSAKDTGYVAIRGGGNNSNNELKVGDDTQIIANTPQFTAGPNWSSGYLALSGSLSGYASNIYPTLRTNGSNIYFDADNTYTGYIGGSTGFTDVSDAREKENVVTIDGALDKVGNLRGVYHTWKDNRDNGRRSVGFIAQEVMEVLPEVVTEAAERYGVSYGKVTALLVEAIKELKEKNDALEARIQTLEGN